MSIPLLGGKKKGDKSLTGGGVGEWVGNVAGESLNMASSLLKTGANMVKGGATDAQAGGGRRRRRSSRRRSSRRRSSSKLRKRTGKVRRHATRSYRKTKRTKRA